MAPTTRAAASSLALLLVGLVTGCARKPDEADAKGALHVVRALSDPDVEAAAGLRMRYQGCAELPGCAAGCAEALAFCATPDSEESQRGAVLADCFSGVDRAAPDRWFIGHFEKFVDASRPLLGEEDQKVLDAARARAK